MTQYVRAWLGTDGCIRLHEHEPFHLPWDKLMFHRGMTLSEFPGVITFDTLDMARENLTDSDEHFILEFAGRGPLLRLWFTPEQFESGVTQRLERWRACYGRYPVARLSSREALVAA